MKKAIKIFSGIVVLIIATAVIVPIIYKDKLANLLKEQINKNIDAKVDFSGVSISIISGFPKATLTLENISVINIEPFKGDTLFYAKEIALKMPMSVLTKSAEDAIQINSFTLDKALVNIISNANGNTNYDIAKKNNKHSSVKLTTEPQKGFTLSVDEYVITNSNINYIDEKSKLALNLNDFNHSGSGDLSNEITKLSTITTSNISLNSGGLNYLNNNTIALNADLEIDKVQNKYTFLENSFKINKLQLIFDGFLKLNKVSNTFDLKFNTPTSDFKNFLALLPAKYAKDIENVNTKGSLSINGYAKGTHNENDIPKFSVNIISKSASLKYPSLPKSIENINVNIVLGNNTGKADDIFLDIKELKLQIDEDTFSAEGKLAQLTNNMLVDMKLNGILNLENLSQAYPIDIDNDFKGVFKAKLHTVFSKNDLDKSNYDQIKNNGEFGLSNFKFTSTGIVNPFYISEANVTFSPETVYLNKLTAKSGDSDISGSGTIDNLMGVIFSNKNFKGNFNINSTLFNVSDFMTSDTTNIKNSQKQVKAQGTLKIPSFLDIEVSANAKKVLYDNLILENVSGDLIIKEETVTLNNFQTEMFDGTMNVNGNVSTKEIIPAFNINLDINQFDINKSLTSMELLSKIAPVAKIFTGKLNTTLALNGKINNAFEIDLSTLTGNAFAELFTTKIAPEEGSAFSLLNNKLSFIDLKKLDLKDLKTTLSFENGSVSIKPFDVKYEDIKIEITGSHSFENNLNYAATFDVPAKYFGSQLGGVLSQLSDYDIKGVYVPVTASIGGSIKNPQISTDMKKSVNKLTNQLIQVQKDKLMNQGTKAATDILEEVIGGNTESILNDVLDTKKDSIKNNAVQDVLGGLFGKKKKKKD
jgi:uncharacterized protein involved in outer membrane biogenesis